jgi:serine/threonine protein kinase
LEESTNSERRRLGRRFVVEREVGRGGVGIVYRAFDLVSERTVALKVIAADAGVAPEEEQRLMREGQLLTTLDHPGIVKTVAFGVLEETGLPYVAMEWLDGEDLAQRQRRDPMSIQQATDLGIKVGEALSAAHSAGVFHRDIKPGNLFLCRSNEVHGSLENVLPKIVDFGVAAKSDIRITRSGDVVGTPAYMAPEQARGDAPIDARSDIYSLGATLFELIAGRPPHVGPTVIATLARLVTTSAPRLAELRRDTPPMIDALVSRMLETDPSARPSSMEEVVELLNEASRDGMRSSWLEPVESVRSSRRRQRRASRAGSSR